ncbi:MAG TPA: hypothetical protein VN317_04270 [Candidatus Methanoperedens sp.]|nr:hypothetical protein [Candidatus Methanoperedens sp.]
MKQVIREVLGILLAALAVAVISATTSTPGIVLLKKAFGIHG